MCQNVCIHIVCMYDTDRERYREKERADKDRQTGREGVCYITFSYEMPTPASNISSLSLAFTGIQTVVGTLLTLTALAILLQSTDYYGFAQLCR